MPHHAGTSAISPTTGPRTSVSANAVVATNRLSDMVHDHQGRAGGIAQPQQTLVQRGHGAQFVLILIARGIERVNNDHFGGCSPRCGNREPMRSAPAASDSARLATSNDLPILASPPTKRMPCGGNDPGSIRQAGAVAACCSRNTLAAATVAGILRCALRRAYCNGEFRCPRFRGTLKRDQRTAAFSCVVPIYSAMICFTGPALTSWPYLASGSESTPARL